MLRIVGIDEPWLNDPFIGAQRRVVVSSVRETRSGTNIDEVMAPVIDDCGGDGVVTIEPDNRTICLRLDHALQVSKRIPFGTPNPHGEMPSRLLSRYVKEFYRF